MKDLIRQHNSDSLLRAFIVRICKKEFFFLLDLNNGKYSNSSPATYVHNKKQYDDMVLHKRRIFVVREDIHLSRQYSSTLMLISLAKCMRHKKERVHVLKMRYMSVWTWAFAKSNNGLYCQLSESLTTVDCIDEQIRRWSVRNVHTDCGA